MLHGWLRGLGKDNRLRVTLFVGCFRLLRAVVCKLRIKLGKQVIAVDVGGARERRGVEVEVVVAHRGATVKMLTCGSFCLSSLPPFPTVLILP